ncbi:MAG: adenine phosphoribosyltransferase [Balneola sp.]|jgi:adenine phosphoribosyltransferase|tara:strand:+ start:131063 stop:131602 length:540 start_codon:yes stop_codon:yes gene_type:complete
MLSEEENIKKYLESVIRTIPDFPKPGIQFKDITTLLSDKKALQLTTQALCQPFHDSNCDIVVGLESRGFLFGTNMAEVINASFVPVRKPGKLPSETISETYELEYGTDSLEIHKDAVKEGDRVIIHDDLIATGGTALAASNLVKRLGGIIIGYSFIIELSFLKGREKLDHETIESVLIM